MLESEIHTSERTWYTAVVCDVCKKRYTFDGQDVMEAQEFFHLRRIGGFGSVFGDEVEVAAEICQHCMKQAFGQYFRVVTEDEE